jgi:transporter family-2 protein
MDKSLAVLCTAAVGGLIALQAPINAGLAKSTDKFPAALISFIVGTLLLAAIVIASGKAGEVANFTEVRWYYLAGGLLGAAYVFTVLVTVSSIGAGGVAAATITGQLTASVIIDRLGVLGLEEVPLGPDRIAGVVLLLAGTLLIVR